MNEPGGRHHLTTWGEEADALLTSLWLEGELSAAKVAARLTESGFPATKNTVLGRVFRMRQAGTLDAPLRQAATRGLARTPRRITTGELPPTGCRWIEGEARGFDSAWCDKPAAVPGCSWCAEHIQRVFRKAEPHELKVLKPQRTGTMLLRASA